MTRVLGQHNLRWISHRIAAHRMHRRGQSLDTIADHLRVSSRSVSRYLALPCPEPVSTEPEGRLEEFYMQGACGAFPELDWVSRSPSMQAECKAVCTHCPVLEQCRTWGLTTGREESGVWGALTKNERQREVARWRKQDTQQQRRDIVAQQQGVA